MNGGSERERKAAVDGWRVYLYRTRFGTTGSNQSMQTNRWFPRSDANL